MKKLGTLVTDIATDIEGILTHMSVDMSRQVNYLFQPKALDPESGKPVTRMWFPEARIKGGIDYEPELPYEVLGTEVEDTGTGFKGMATVICLHISGCVHVEVKPKVILAKTGTTGESIELDIRRLKGPAIKIMTEDEIEADQKQKPSPDEHPAYRSMPDM